jgi:DNA modification methylase
MLLYFGCEHCIEHVMSDQPDLRALPALFTSLPETWYTNGATGAVLGDCLPILQSIKGGSIDLVFADPPYNIGKEFEPRIMDRDSYIAWCRSWLDECMRVLKPDGTMYLMAATQYMPYLDCSLDSTFTVKSRIVWCYDSSGVQARGHFGSMYEPILMVVKDKDKYTFNTDAVMVEARSGAVRNLIDYRKTPPRPYSTKKVMGNVWQIPRVRFKMAEYENHGTQKPEKLVEIPILASSNPGDVVLDPFAGSFTTCAVAQRLGRASIGIEIEEKYFKMGLRRLGLAGEYKGEPLVKVKVRKTRNKSKMDHLKAGTLQDQTDNTEE